jgi:hypothetical protein
MHQLGEDREVAKRSKGYQVKKKFLTFTCLIVLMGCLVSSAETVCIKRRVRVKNGSLNSGQAIRAHFLPNGV